MSCFYQDIIDAVRTRLSLESHEVKKERVNISSFTQLPSTSFPNQQQQEQNQKTNDRMRIEESKWYTNKVDMKPLHKLAMSDDDDISVGSLDDVMKELVREMNS